MQINDGITDVGDLVQLFQTLDDHIADDAGGDFGAAHALQGGFDLADQALDIGGGDRALGAGDADAAGQLFAVKLLARAVLL